MPEPSNMAVRKSRDSDCCSVNFLKYVLHIFNIVFLMSGLAVLGVGVWTVAEKHSYVALLTTATYVLTAYVLIAAGVLVILGTVIGCVSLLRENRCLLLIYTFLLLLIFLMEAMVGILSYVYAEQLQTELNLNLNATFLDRYKVEADQTIAIDRMQEEFKCCGAARFDDWKYSKWLLSDVSTENLVPDSCCISVMPGCGKRDHPSNIHYSGCKYKLEDEIKAHLNILGAVGLGISVLQIFGMIFSCSLYIKLKNVVD